MYTPSFPFNFQNFPFLELLLPSSPSCCFKYLLLSHQIKLLNGWKFPRLLKGLMLIYPPES